MPAADTGVVAATRWLAETNLVDPMRVCIYGSGTEGYAALLAASEAPELYRCAALLNSPTDPVDVNLDPTRFVSPDFAPLRPTRRVRDIRSPIVFLHGEKNQTVPAESTREFVRRRLTAHLPTNYIELPDEDHTLERAASRELFARELLEFLASYLN
jgi:dipeptidyl aminopeptidase/acylaminoacyl peptidase